MENNVKGYVIRFKETKENVYDKIFKIKKDLDEWLNCGYNKDKVIEVKEVFESDFKKGIRFTNGVIMRTQTSKLLLESFKNINNINRL